MSPYEIQSLIFIILGSVAFLGFLSLAVFGVVLLVKGVLTSNGLGMNNIKKEQTLRTKVISKRSNLSAGLMTFYYISFEGLFEFKVSRKIYKIANVSDIVSITYEGEKLIELFVIEKSGEVSIPKNTATGTFSDKDIKKE